MKTSQHWSLETSMTQIIDLLKYGDKMLFNNTSLPRFGLFSNLTFITLAVNMAISPIACLG